MESEETASSPLLSPLLSLRCLCVSAPLRWIFFHEVVSIAALMAGVLLVSAAEAGPYVSTGTRGVLSGTFVECILFTLC